MCRKNRYSKTMLNLVIEKLHPGCSLEVEEIGGNKVYYVMDKGSNMHILNLGVGSLSAIAETLLEIQFEHENYQRDRKLARLERMANYKINRLVTTQTPQQLQQT
jgi:hypothetical protein